MKRKDGQPKAKALRTKPVFDHGHKDSINALDAGFHDTLPSRRTVLSLFSGCGGLDLGFHGGFSVFGNTHHRSHFELVDAIDFDQDCVDAYNLNIGPARRGDLSNIPVGDLRRADVVIGGFPCQDFSSSGSKRGMSTERGQLYQVLINYADYHRPSVVVGENVPYLAKLHGGVYLREIEASFKRIGYRLDVWTVVCQNHGLPQSRTRLFLVATEDHLPHIPAPKLPVTRLTIQDALADLEAIEDETIPNQSQYFVSTLASVGGGQGDHKNPTTGGVAYTIRANARGRIQFHHNLERRLTVRECARLQSFPDSFVFPFTTQRNLKLIGNAVPPMIAHHIAVHIQKALDQELSYEEAMQPQLVLSL